jgi:nitrous oxidase accessory protein
MMQRHLEAYYDFFGRPLGWTVRVLLLLSLVALPYVWIGGPLWTMSFTSNQYPDPLKMAIHVDHLEGQVTADRDDLREINSLNRYIGMRPLLESDFAEFLWLPFAVGIFGLLCLRLIFFGRLRDIVDVFVLFVYFAVFSFWDFYNKLYSYGHVLDPEAPITVEPFTPPLYGKTQIANFWIESFPGGASYALIIFGGLLGLATLLALFQAWRDWRRQRRGDSGNAQHVPGGVAMLAVLATGLIIPAKSSAAELQVGPGAQYASPAAALAAAADGDLILIAPGSYTGSLVLDKRVTLRGSEHPAILGEHTGSVITLAAEGARIEGLAISGSGIDMMHSDAGIHITADDVQVKDCILTDNLFGVMFRLAENAIVEECTIRGRAEVGIGSRGAGFHLYDSHNCILRGNDVKTVRDGVYFDHANYNKVEDNVFAELRYGVHYMYCESNEFYRNTFRDSVAGAAIMYTEGVSFSENLILNNRLGHNAFGLLFQSCDDCLAERNVIVNNTCGFFLEGARNNILRNNLVAYNDVGAVIFGSSSGNTLESNDFIQNIATLRTIGRSDNGWGGAGKGNYYSDYEGYDLDGDGLGDVPHKLQDAFEHLTGNHPLLKLYLSSAAADALVLAERSFPVLPHSDVTDPEPMTHPVSGVRLQLDPGDKARPRGSLALAALALLGWGGCLLGIKELAR